MICDYYRSAIAPSEVDGEVTGFEITHNGTKPSVRVGGSAKVFTAQLPSDNHFDVQWSLVDGDKTYGGSYENSTVTYGDYTITTEDRTMKLEVNSNYDLIGTKLIIKAHCADGSEGQIEVEVVG